MIKITGLTKKLSDFVLREINLEINDKEYFVILGPTGTGKTVLLELIAGLEKPDQGQIWSAGREITNLVPEERNIGMVYQDFLLFPHLTVKENISFGLKMRGFGVQHQEEALKKMVKLFKIEHLLPRRTDNLSGGEQQRVALARALITDPQLLLLDEPLSALDPVTKEKFQQDLKYLHQKLGTTTIHITHDFNEALLLADRIGIMEDGRLVQVGNPQEVFQHPVSPFVARFVGMKNIFQGEVIKEGVDCLIRVNDQVLLAALTEKEGQVNLAIRPEDIIISYQMLPSSARNSFKGKIIKIVEKLALVELTVDIGIRLAVVITRHSLLEMNLVLGKEVYITFKASAVHVY